MKQHEDSPSARGERSNAKKQYCRTSRTVGKESHDEEEQCRREQPPGLRAVSPATLRGHLYDTLLFIVVVEWIPSTLHHTLLVIAFT